MRVLLDTHVLLWCLQGSPRLREQGIRLIQSADEVHVSVASLWEMAIKLPLGKLELDVDFAEIPKVIEESGYELLQVKAEHAVQVTRLPPLHRDPFDRMLVAQSIAEPLRLITSDPAVARYDDNVILI